MNITVSIPIRRIAFTKAALLGALIISFLLVAPACNRSSTQPAAVEGSYEPMILAAVKLVEEKRPFSPSDPNVLAFRQQYSSVLGILLVVDSANRIALIRDESTSETIDERKRPVRGVLRFPDGTTRSFLEFRRDCQYDGSKAVLLLRVADPS